MTQEIATGPVGQLVLARLLVPGQKGATNTEIRKALEPLLGHRWTGTALWERIEAELSSLESSRCLVSSRKGRTERFTLTAEGTAHALRTLGLAQLPPKITWDKLKKTVLSAHALGLPSPQGDAAKLISTDNGFKAALLRTVYQLPIDEVPKLDDAIAALCWILLDLPPGRKFDVKTVQSALIQRAFGGASPLGPKPDPKKELPKLLAQKVGARQSGKDELRAASFRRWIDAEPAPPQGDAVTSPESVPEPAHAPAPSPSPPPFLEPAHAAVPQRDEPGPSMPEDAEGFDLATFARRSVEEARQADSGRFGDHRVFISHVWRRLQADPTFGTLTLDAFKRHLVEANNARLLTLGRADMVEAMDADDVRESETDYLGSSFHFVRT